MVSEENEHDRLARRLAFYGILFGGFIALGTAFVSIGGTLVVSVIPQLHDTIVEAENNSTNLNKMHEKALTDKFNLILWEANSSTFFIVGGLILVLLGIGNSYVFMIRRPRQNHAHSQLNDLSVSIRSESSQANEYTGNNYYATRKRMSYHPPDKMFPNKTSKSNYAQKQEPKKQRGTLPKGF
jgi:hypothetical protein